MGLHYQDFLSLEKRLARTPKQIAAVLGMSYSNYMTIRCGLRPVKDYVKVHVDTLLQLDGATLDKIARGRVKEFKDGP